MIYTELFFGLLIWESYQYQSISISLMPSRLTYFKLQPILNLIFPNTLGTHFSLKYCEKQAKLSRYNYK